MQPHLTPQARTTLQHAISHLRTNLRNCPTLQQHSAVRQAMLILSRILTLPGPATREERLAQFNFSRHYYP